MISKYKDKILSHSSQTYLSITDKPTINGVTLEGNLAADNIDTYATQDVERMINELRQIEIVPDFPENPERGTLYYVGTQPPYDMYIYDSSLKKVYLGTSSANRFSGDSEGIFVDDSEETISALYDDSTFEIIDNNMLRAKLVDVRDGLYWDKTEGKLDAAFLSRLKSTYVSLSKYTMIDSIGTVSTIFSGAINLGYYPTTNTSIKFRASISNSSGSVGRKNWLIGAGNWGDWGGYRFGVNKNSSGSLQFFYTINGTNHDFVISDQTKYCGPEAHDIEIGNKYIKWDGVKIADFGAATVPDIKALGYAPLQLFTRSSKRERYNVAKVSIFESGKQVREYRPVKRNSDGTLGMYEMFEGKFWPVGVGFGVDVGVNLPAGYTRVHSFISSTGANINTGWVPTPKTECRLWHMDDSTSTSSSSLTYNRVLESTSYGLTCYLTSGGLGSISYKFGSTTAQESWTIADWSNEMHYMRFGNGYCRIDGTDKTWTAKSTFTDKTNPLYIFGSLTNVKHHMYRIQILEDGVLVRDYIPCIEKVTDRQGVYDQVNKVFTPANPAGAATTWGQRWYNLQETTMIGKDHIVEYIPDAYERVDTLRSIATTTSPGPAYFPTDFKATSSGATRIVMRCQLEGSDSDTGHMRRIVGTNYFKIGSNGVGLEWNDNGFHYVTLPSGKSAQGSHTIEYAVNTNLPNAVTTLEFDSLALLTNQAAVAYSGDELIQVTTNWNGKAAPTIGCSYLDIYHNVKTAGGGIGWYEWQLVRHFIPVKRKSDNKYGLYDTITNKFILAVDNYTKATPKELPYPDHIGEYEEPVKQTGLYYNDIFTGYKRYDGSSMSEVYPGGAGLVPLPPVEDNAYLRGDGLWDNCLSDSLIGEIRIFAGDEVPMGWLECNGQQVSKYKYAALYKVLGTKYNVGTVPAGTFCLPDFRQRFAKSVPQADVGKTGTPHLPGFSARINLRDGAFLGPYGNYANHPLEKDCYTGAFKIVPRATAGDKYADSGSYITDAYKGTSYSAMLNLSLNKQNAIYGKSKTVQPDAVIMKFLIKY